MKPCKKVPAEHLLAYHLNALSPLRKRQLAWHLKACADCRHSLQAEQTLDSRLRLGEAPVQPFPTPSRQLALRLGGATLALSGLVAGAVLLRPGTPGGPQIAFADIERALNDTRYITWTQTQETILTSEAIKRKFLGQKRPRKSHSTYWAEVQPLRIVAHGQDSGRESYYYADSTHNESSDGAGHYTWVNTYDEDSSVPAIKRLILTPLHQGYPNALPRFVKNISPSTWQQRTVTLQEKPAILLERVQTYTFQEDTSSTTRTERIWVAPASKKILRRESHIRWAGGVELHEISENFRYLDTVPNGTFDPPRPQVGENYTFSNLTGPERKLTVENKAFDTAIRTQVNQIVSAMNAGDGRRLASMGDSEVYASDGPEIIDGKSRARRAAYLKGYLKYVGQQRILRNWKIDRLPGSFTSVLSYWHRQEEGAAFPPIGPMEVDVHLSGMANVNNGPRKKVYSFAKFRMTPGGPKLIWFNPNIHK